MNLLLASFDLGDALILTLEIFFFIIWVWIFVAIVVDLFRDHELGGFAKAIWLLFLIVIPFLSAFVYLIARGHGMRDRAVAEQAELVRAQNAYIRDIASSTPADDLAKLHALKEKGALTDSEYEAAKAKIVF